MTFVKKEVQEVEQPWTMVQIHDGFPVLAHIRNDDRRIGPINFKLHGEVPLDLSILISESPSAVTEQNATWNFRHKTQFSIYPADQRS